MQPVISTRRRAAGAGAAVLGLPAVTAAGLAASSELVVVLLVYLVVTVVAAAIGGIWPGLLSAVGALAAASWFFTAPPDSLTVADPRLLAAIATFAVVAAVTSWLADAVARRTVEAARARARAAEAEAASEVRDALLSTVSHDLRTPLSTIKSWTTTLLEPDVEFPPDQVDEMLRTVVAEVDRLDAMVGNLLDLSRVRAGTVSVSVQEVAVEEVLPAALAGLDGARGRVEVTVEDCPLVLADPAMLERVLSNLVVNALRYAPPGTTVGLAAAPADADRVEIRVVDHGPGVAPGDAEAVFEPFQRLGDGGGDGLGLGLAVARGLVRAMSGDVTVEETPGDGATFVVRLRPAWVRH